MIALVHFIPTHFGFFFHTFSSAFLVNIAQCLSDLPLYGTSSFPLISGGALQLSEVVWFFFDYFAIPPSVILCGIPVPHPWLSRPRAFH